ncbi:MAG: hypothetical protein CMG25_00085 [Candidatus Marinimicrobia bacterium]|nr:hypothetical protein [Candidatus Neomarinimicrobiota bacterium]MAQ42884.1 hypothetical protein [Candidatus Neomarinimicrobiota bacterium]
MFKKILFYNNPDKVIARFNRFNTKQKWLFIDGIAMILFAIYFYKIELLFGFYMCIVFSIISFIGIQFIKR